MITSDDGESVFTCFCPEKVMPSLSKPLILLLFPSVPKGSVLRFTSKPINQLGCLLSSSKDKGPWSLIVFISSTIITFSWSSFLSTFVKNTENVQVYTEYVKMVYSNTLISPLCNLISFLFTSDLPPVSAVPFCSTFIMVGHSYVTNPSDN